MIREVTCTDVDGLAGGKGIAHVHHIVTKEELNGHGRLYARVVLPPGSCVGWHQHIHDTEPYYILRGEGDFYEADSGDGERKKTRVHAGQVCVINVGQWHCLENTSGEDLEFMALIYNAPGYDNREV
ncbi:MAG: cupin domain-containing protein [Synergistaceae bacterium]|nr:cupin domain-containing protein [Synergistaceae bacterium]MBR0034191.1 cupin domain-containing protein [Synergistaceae bacterium]